MDVYLPIADSLVGMVNTLVWMWSSLLNTLILSLLNLWFFLSFLLFSTLIPIFLLSPVTSHFVANRCFHQTAQKNLTVSEKTNLSSAWTYVELHLYPMIIYLCASWTTSDDEEEILLRTGWTWRQKMDKDSVTWMQNKGWQRWNMGGGMYKALAHSLYYQLALQIGWSWHGDREGGLQWEQSGFPVGLGMLCWSVLFCFVF